MRDRATPHAVEQVSIPRDHYRQLLIMAAQDLAEASATELAATGAYDGPGPSCTMAVADAFAVEPTAATVLVATYVEALDAMCDARGLRAPALEGVVAGIAATVHPRLHAPVDVGALAAHLLRTVPTHGRQTIVFHPRHRDGVLDGSKTVTVRWGERIEPGPALLVLGDSADDVLDGRVHAVDQVAIAGLTPAAVHEADGTDMAEYVRLLRTRYYPTMPDDGELDVVVFAVDRAEANVREADVREAAAREADAREAD